MNIIHIGSSNALSLLPLQALLAAGYNIQAIVMDDGGYDQRSHFPLIDVSGTSLESLAYQQGISLLRAGSDWTSCIERLHRCSPDIIVVSCFPYRLPAEIFTIPSQGCINLHPSLLPAYRGPDPLFWQFREGAGFGVSLHSVSAELDAGSVLAQKVVNIPDGIACSAASRLLAEVGAELLLMLLAKMKLQSLVGQPQDASQASYQSFPEKEDFTLNTEWTARRMYNFICAMRERVSHFPCTIEGHTYALIEAYSYQVEQQINVEISQQHITVPCVDGSVEAGFLLE